MSGPSFFRPAPLGTLAVILAILGCSATDGADSSDSINEGGFGFGGMSGGGGFTQPPLGGGAPGAFDYSALCGLRSADCIPSALDPSCKPQEGPGAGGSAAGGDGPGTGSGGDGGLGGGSSTGTGGPAAVYGCQIASEQNEPAATCDVTGSANVGAVCNASSDCSPGLGCVLSSVGNGEGGGAAPAVGLCRPYCCGDLEECPKHTTFCAPQPLFDAAAELDDPSTAIQIPVCMPIVECPLLGDTCGEGQTCSIVRADGETSCVPIGDGELCSPCPCAEGYVCSFSSGTCQKLCDTNMTDCPGEGAICQGGSLPNDVGLCVLGDSDCN